MSEESEEKSESGAPIYRYDPDQVEQGFQPARGEEHIEAISDHIEEHIGPVESVFHEVMSEIVHVDVHIVAPTADYPFYTLVTSGMSDLPMTAPDGYEDYRHAEVYLQLPADWPLKDQDVMQQEEHYWPIRWLKIIARFPHTYHTFIASGHTIPNGEEAAPLGPGTELGCMMAVSGGPFPEEFDVLPLEDGTLIHFYQLVPLYPAEMNLKLSKGMEALMDKFDEHDIADAIDPRRVNTCAKKRGGFFSRWKN